jgi:hypothetical protein
MLESVDKIIIVGLIIISSVHVKGVLYPDSLQKATSCDEFSKFARFNPYSVLNDHWFVFYYWGPEIPRTEFVFEYPGPRVRFKF